MAVKLLDAVGSLNGAGSGRDRAGPCDETVLIVNKNETACALDAQIPLIALCV